MDRIYAISSDKMVEEFKRQRNEKARKEEEKMKKRLDKQKKQLEKQKNQLETQQKTQTNTARKRKTKSSKPPKKSCPPHITEDIASSTDEEDVLSIHDSSDDSIDLDDGGEFGIKLPLQEPSINSWVGVKVERSHASTSSRPHSGQLSFEIYIGKVIDSNDEGMTVSFLKQKNETFYFFPDVEDSSCPVYKDEVVVLDDPVTKVMNRSAGFVFPSAIKSSIASYFQK